MWEEAREQLQRARWIKQISEHEDEWRARIALGRGRYEEVIRLAKSDKEDAGNLGPTLAVAYARLGRQDEALQVASEAVKRHTEGAERAMGDVFAEAGDYDNALRWYERSLRRKDYAGTMRLIGKTLVALGDYREAAAALERAIRYSRYVCEEDLSLLAECLRKVGKEHAANEVERTGNRLLDGEQKRSNVPSER